MDSMRKICSVLGAVLVIGPFASASSAAVPSDESRVVRDRRIGQGQPVSSHTDLKVGGILASREHPEDQYVITYLFSDRVWADLLSADERRRVGTFQFSRWQLNGAWSYAPPEAGRAYRSFASEVSRPRPDSEERRQEEIVFLSVQEAVQQNPELAPRIPNGTDAVALAHSIRIHCSDATQRMFRTLMSQVWVSSELQGAVQFRDLSDIRPYAFVIVEEGLKKPPAVGTTPVAILNLQETPITSWTDLLRQCLTQLIGQPIPEIRGAARLRDGRIALFL